MTAEVDARSDVSHVLEKRDLAYEDFAKGGALVGVGISLPKDNEIGSDGPCDSYLMINCSDEVADDSALKDPDRDAELECFGNGNIEIDAEPEIDNGDDPKFCVSEEIGGVGHVVEKDLGESASNLLMNDIEVRSNVSDGEEKQGEDTETESSEKVEDMPKSDGSVCVAVGDNCKYPQEDKEDVKIVSDSNGIDGEFGELKSSITHTDAFVPEQNGDAVDKDDNGNKLYASPNKNEEDVAVDEKHLILNEKHLVVNGKDSVVGQSGDKEEEVEQNLVTVPSIALGSGVCLPAGEDQDGNLQTAEDVKSENAYDDCDIVCGETLATSTDSATKMDIVGEGPFEDHLVVEKSLAESLDKDTCLVDDKDAQAEGSISGDIGAELPISADENIASNTSMSNDLLLISQNILEGNRQLENTVMASSIVMVGSVEINCKKAFPPLPFNNAAIKSFHFFPAVENLRLDMKDKSSPASIDNPDSGCLQGTKIETKSENGTVDEDTQSSCFGNDQGNLNHVSDINEVESNGSTCQEVEVVDEIKSENGTVDEDTQSSCLGNDQGNLNHVSDVNEVESNGSTCQEVEVVDEIKSENGTVDEDTQSSCLANDQGNLNHVSDVNEVESNGSTCQEVEVVDEINCGSFFGTLECSTRDTAESLTVVSEVESEPVYFVTSSSYEEDTQSSCFSNDQGSINHASEANEVESNESSESNGSTCQEVKVIGEINWGLSFGTLECSTRDTAKPLNEVAEVGSGGPFYFVRIPRYEDEFIREKIRHAQSLVDEKTRIQDSFRDQIQTTKAACKELSSNLSAAKSEARAARESLKLKRKEIETAQSMINKAKDAISIDEIGIKINKIEHKIAHETLPSKEEKQLIHDIKQLIRLRDQLSLDAGKQGELQLALDQKCEVEERLTLLRKEMDLIMADVFKADELTTSMLKKYDGEKEKLNGLQAESEEANKIRQEAYVDLQCLKKPFDEKRKYFRKYKNDMEVADNLAFRKDGEKLQAHAINQVETFMERWNTDDEFRKDYIRCNTRSTLRRLGTFDGRSLASDDDPPVLNNVVEERDATDNLVSPGLTVEQNKPAGLVETLKDNHKPAKGVKKKKQKTKTNNPVAAFTTLPDDQESNSGGVELADTKDSSGVDLADTREKNKRSKEEEVLEKRAEELRKRKEEEAAEELRKEEEAIRLQEQLKLEEKAKAELALARKKRKAERAEARAAIRAQKEAEEKEKEKEKKARRRRKKKKKSADEEAKNKADIEEEPQPAVSQEPPTDTPENAEKAKTTSTKSQKRPQSTKQNKAKAIISPPLRKRGKRKMEMWVWILVTVMIVLAVFFLGNGGYLGKLGMGRFRW